MAFHQKTFRISFVLNQQIKFHPALHKLNKAATFASAFKGGVRRQLDRKEARFRTGRSRSDKKRQKKPSKFCCEPKLAYLCIPFAAERRKKAEKIEKNSLRRLKDKSESAGGLHSGAAKRPGFSRKSEAAA